tara:strand:- start:12929 stop:13111 length:183 start_codon:yes stop_codon:yes gene_type:complete
MEQLNKAEVRASIMVQILEDNKDDTLIQEDYRMINKKFLEAYTIKDALEVIKVLLTNKNK